MCSTCASPSLLFVSSRGEISYGIKWIQCVYVSRRETHERPFLSVTCFPQIMSSASCIRSSLPVHLSIRPHYPIVRLTSRKPFSLCKFSLPSIQCFNSSEEGIQQSIPLLRFFHQLKNYTEEKDRKFRSRH